MKLTYLNIANQAAEAEREGDYLKATQLWEQAKHLTKSDAVRQWAEYRVELNTLRNSLDERTEKYRIEKEERRQKKAKQALLKKQIELLETNINKTSEVHCE